MSNLMPYIEPILCACLVFPLAAGLFTLPFLIVNYRKYGGIAVMRVLVVYSFILYSMCAFFLTMLPLPSREVVAAAGPKPILWIPFTDFFTCLKNAGMLTLRAFLVPSNWIHLLTSKDMFQILANVVMQIPLGFYLHYYFKCSFRKTMIIGFLVSLFYEVTQLTGIYGIYAYAYRFASVDDLMHNTLGALIGFAITPLLAHFLPSREEIDRISYAKANTLTLVRRVCAAIIDLLLFTTGAAVIGWVTGKQAVFSFIPMRLSFVLFVIAYFCVIPCLTQGSTLGHLAVRLKIVDQDGHRPHPGQYLLRFCMLYLVEPFIFYLNIFAAGIAVVFALADGWNMIVRLIGIVLCLGFVVFSVVTLVKDYKKYGTSLHSRFSRTELVIMDTSLRKYRIPSIY